jgi:hypothetical protein
MKTLYTLLITCFICAVSVAQIRPVLPPEDRQEYLEDPFAYTGRDFFGHNLYVSIRKYKGKANFSDQFHLVKKNGFTIEIIPTDEMFEHEMHITAAGPRYIEFNIDGEVWHYNIGKLHGWSQPLEPMLRGHTGSKKLD